LITIIYGTRMWLLREHELIRHLINTSSSNQNRMPNKTNFYEK
jgi:hypothetical protein